MERKTGLSRRRRHFQVLIQGLAADSELARKRCLLFAGTGAAAQLGSLVARQRLLAATIYAPLLGQRDPLPLPLADQRPFELSERPHDRQQEVRHRRILAGEAQAFLHEFDAYAVLGKLLHQAAQIVQVARQAIHAVHHYRVAFARKRQQGIKLRPLGILAGCHVDELPVHLDVIELAFGVLVETADPYDPSRPVSINYKVNPILTELSFFEDDCT